MPTAIFKKLRLRSLLIAALIFAVKFRLAVSEAEAKTAIAIAKSPRMILMCEYNHATIEEVRPVTPPAKNRVGNSS